MKDPTWDELYKRLCIATGATSEAALATAIGISHQAVYDAKKKGSVPYKWILSIAIKFDISADWLYFGTGPMRRNANPPEYITNTYEVVMRETQKQVQALQAQLQAAQEEIRQLELELRTTQAEALRAYRLATQSMPPATQKVQEEPGFTTGGQDNTQALKTSLIHQNGSPNEAK